VLEILPEKVVVVDINGTKILNLRSEPKLFKAAKDLPKGVTLIGDPEKYK